MIHSEYTYYTILSLINAYIVNVYIIFNSLNPNLIKSSARFSYSKLMY